MNDIFKNLDLNREQLFETIKEFLATKPHLDAQVADELELKNATQGLYRCNISTNSGICFIVPMVKRHYKVIMVMSSFQN